MLYVCNTCNKVYKYKKNLTRHMNEKHNPFYEHWNCVLENCSSVFIRKEYLCNHLEKFHGYNRAEAISAALNATRGDQGYNDELEDISDDDTVFDLLEELEELENVTKKNVNQNQDNCFDIDDILSDVSDNSSSNKESDLSVKGDGEFSESDTGSIDMNNNHKSESEDIEIVEISDEEVETAVDHSQLRTKIQTVTLTCERKTFYVNGVTAGTETLCYHDYYELFV